MARGVARVGSGRPVFSELQQNGDPPASTLAAQLVNHFTDGKQHSKNQDQETFRQLLHEVLGANDEKHPQPQVFETDSDVNYKLIYVIFKAGLEVFILDDPSGTDHDQCRQAIDSLAAIEHTVRSSPEVLFAVPVGRETDPKLKAPLFLWLVPKLLALTGAIKSDEIRNGVTQLLKTAIIVGRKVHIKEVKINSVLKYIKGCTKGQSL